jgi:glycosyltransferase involved in cell wall biosynthesis
MHIAQIAPLYETVPPKWYGGTERVVAHLCDALVELGHEVTLFAADGAQTKARLVAVRDQAIRLDSALLKSDLGAHFTLLSEVKRLARHFDVLHFHVDLLHFPMFEPEASKTVTTVHGRLDLKDLAPVYRRWSSFGLVSISNSQRRQRPEANWLATIGHGVPSHRYPLNAHPEGMPYLAFLGRLCPEKRPDVAIRLALRARIPLRIAAKVDAVDVLYFDTYIRPLLQDPLIEYIGEIGDERKAEFLGNARALLFPIAWPEPFGLVMIEAMACGTPIIAWKCGAVPEVIDDGVTGFIVNSEDEALAAIARVSDVDRRCVRAVFERRFTATMMASAYLEVYVRLLKSPSARRIVSAAGGQYELGG